MYKPLQSFYPNPDDLLAMKPNEFGDLIVLELWGDNEKLNRGNFANDATRSYPANYKDKISRAVMEAWSWLVGQQLIAETPETGWFFLTRAGEERRLALRKLDDSGLEKGLDVSTISSVEENVSQNETTQAPDPEIRDETVFGSTVGDQPAREDSLGFEPYVKAVADFLTNPLTVPPLTISIEGDWGAGKSSFMAQLEDLLRARGNLTLQFNAWRHDKHEELWAAFALEFIRQISTKQNAWKRLWANFSLRRRRFDWTEGWLDLIRVAGAWLVLLVAAIGLPVLLVFKGPDWLNWINKSITDGSLAGNITAWFVGLGSSFAAIVGIASLMLKLKKYLGNPLTIDLRKHLRSPQYEDRVAFIENFHKDLNRIVRSFVGKRKVFVFIDDLDRCEVPKAAELMQAINLMIADDPQLIFIIGMDREKIAAGIAAKQEKLLPFLTSFPEEDNTGRSLAGLYYGYRFIEKFIQVPFTVPVATLDDFNRFLEGLTSRPQQVNRYRARWWHALPAKWFARKTIRGEPKLTSVKPADSASTYEQVRHRQQLLKLINGEAETKAIRNIILMAAGLLDKNPRRLKQFINLFRLRAHIASETGLFDLLAGTNLSHALTLEQLGKFVAITQMHPRLLFDLEADYQLITKLQLVAQGKELPEDLQMTPTLQFWAKDSRLMDFFRYGLSEGSKAERDRFSLANLDAKRLLDISPRVQRSAAIGQESSDGAVARFGAQRLSPTAVAGLTALTESTFRQFSINQEFKPRLTVFALDYNSSQPKLVQVARYSWEGAAIGSASISLHQGVAGRSLRELKSILVDDVNSAALDLGFSVDEAKRFNAEVASVVCIPIIGAASQAIGVLALDVIASKVLGSEHVEVLEAASPLFSSLLAHQEFNEFNGSSGGRVSTLS